jgi:hypothetical protein
MYLDLALATSWLVNFLDSNIARSVEANRLHCRRCLEPGSYRIHRVNCSVQHFEGLPVLICQSAFRNDQRDFADKVVSQCRH